MRDRDDTDETIAAEKSRTFSLSRLQRWLCVLPRVAVGLHHCAALSRPQCLSQRDASDGGAGPLAGGAAAAGHGGRTRLHRGSAGLQRAGRTKHQPGSSSQQVGGTVHITACRSQSPVQGFYSSSLFLHRFGFIRSSFSTCQRLKSVFFFFFVPISRLISHNSHCP